MLNHLKEKKDVGFFTSIAGLMNSCSVLDLDAFERNTKAEGEQIVIRLCSITENIGFVEYFRRTNKNGFNMHIINSNELRV